MSSGLRPDVEAVDLRGQRADLHRVCDAMAAEACLSVRFIRDVTGVVHTKTSVDSCARVLEPYQWITSTEEMFVTCFMCFMFEQNRQRALRTP